MITLPFAGTAPRRPTGGSWWVAPRRARIEMGDTICNHVGLDLRLRLRTTCVTVPSYHPLAESLEDAQDDALTVSH